MKILIILMSSLLLAGCFDSGAQEGNEETKRADASNSLGEEVFEKNCISCHGKEAQGLTKDWKKRDENGKYPAPPLNGTAHAWHHSPKVLMTTIDNGGVKLGGWMPGFKDRLSKDEKQAVVDYIYGLWPAELQEKYDARFKK